MRAVAEFIIVISYRFPAISGNQTRGRGALVFLLSQDFLITSIGGEGPPQAKKIREGRLLISKAFSKAAFFPPFFLFPPSLHGASFSGRVSASLMGRPFLHPFSRKVWEDQVTAQVTPHTQATHQHWHALKLAGPRAWREHKCGKFTRGGAAAPWAAQPRQATYRRALE